MSTLIKNCFQFVNGIKHNNENYPHLLHIFSTLLRRIRGEREREGIKKDIEIVVLEMLRVGFTDDIIPK